MDYRIIERTTIEDFVGKTFQSIIVEDEKIVFSMNNADGYLMYHISDCCEEVVVEDICGEIDWLIGSPILLAQERTSEESPQGFDKGDEDWSNTWTFYELATIKGSVTIRWHGSSNGYYSEYVSLEKVALCKI